MSQTVIATPGSVVLTQEQLLSLLDSQIHALNYLIQQRDAQIAAWKGDYPARLAEYLSYVRYRLRENYEREFRIYRDSRRNATAWEKRGLIDRIFDTLLRRKKPNIEPMVGNITEDNSVLDFALAKLNVIGPDEFTKYALETFKDWRGSWESKESWERLQQVEERYVRHYTNNQFEGWRTTVIERNTATVRADGATFVLTEADFKSINACIDKAKKPLEPVQPAYPNFDPREY